MGVSVVISGAIMISVLLISSITMVNLMDNMLKSHNMRLDTKNTDIEISDIVAESNDDLIIITISNKGASKLWNYGNFDLIVTYDANITDNMVRVTEYLSYSHTLSNGKWIISSITNDIADPDILNPSEEAIINAQLTNTIHPNGKLIVAVSTDDGAVSTIGGLIA